ncbi:NUT family member 1, partial [Emydura macquarii macquarii]|uniref:NUT family member 1 n=1 Tax=Emydura macquarii macquarii TaxID=1129001 RepID=UPI00352B07DF
NLPGPSVPLRPSCRRSKSPALPRLNSQPRQGPPPLLLPAFPGTALLLGSPDVPGGKLIIKLTSEGAQEPGRAQAIILAGAPAGWAPPRRDGGPPLRLQLAAGIRTVLLSKAGEQPGSREPPAPVQAPPPPSDPAASCTSKGVYENYRRWQRYKALARRHFPGTPDAEALACFFIPVLRSLSRLRPALAPEEGVPRAVQEWERSSNFERMIFYEMAEKFMEFEAEEELQIQKMKLLSSSRFQLPAVEPPKPPGPPAPDVGQQQVYIPKKAASKGRQPRRRQCRPPGPPGPPAPGEPREIPPEAVRQYAEIMEGLRPGSEEEAGGRGEHQSQAQGALPDPGLLRYLERLCEDESFVCKVEAVIHPQFLAQLLSPEKRRDLLDLSEELEGELGLTPSQLVEKRLLALSEEELSPPACPAPQSDSTPSQSDEEDEGDGQRPTPGQLGSIGRRPKGSRPSQDREGPSEAQAASEAMSGHRAEPERKWVMVKGSPRPRLQDGGTPAGPGDPGTTGNRGNATTSWGDGNEAGEASPAMGDGPSKMVAITHIPEDMKDAGKCGDDEDDEELSVFSSLLASKLRLSSPEGPVGTVPWDQGGPHGRAPSPTWGPTRWDATRRCSTRPGPGEGLDGSHPTDPGIRRSHKRRSDKMATRRSKRLRSQ